MAAENVVNKQFLMSDQQLKAWVSGEIENIRFDAETGMLTYRLTAAPESRISFKVPEERLEQWQICQMMWADMKAGTFRLDNLS